MIHNNKPKDDTMNAPNYSATADTLTKRIFGLIPKNLSILEMDSAYDLMKVEGFECADLAPSLAQAQFALGHAKRLYAEITAEVTAATSRPASGPFPLKVFPPLDHRKKIVIETATGNHYATTYDPEAARFIASAPETAAERDRLRTALAELIASVTCQGTVDTSVPIAWSGSRFQNIRMRAALRDARAAIARAPQERGEG